MVRAIRLLSQIQSPPSVHCEPTMRNRRLAAPRMATGAVDERSPKQQGDVAGAMEHWRDMQGDGLENFAFQPVLSWSRCDRRDDRLLRLCAQAGCAY